MNAKCTKACGIAAGLAFFGFAATMHVVSHVVGHVWDQVLYETSPSQNVDIEVTQRWKGGRDSYRPAREVIVPNEYEVKVIEQRDAKSFIVTHHYSRTFPAQRLSIGLIWHGEIVGVCTFSVGAQRRAVKRWTAQEDPNSAVELGRLVLLDEVPANAESFFIARCFRILKDRKPGIDSVYSYADPTERTDMHGVTVKPGHLGIIYQATNALYKGRSSAENLLLDPKGRPISRRSICKIKHHTRGWAPQWERIREYSTFEAPPTLDEWRDFLADLRSCSRLRVVPHTGNHVYVWHLRGHFRKGDKESLPYPKILQGRTQSHG